MLKSFSTLTAPVIHASRAGNLFSWNVEIRDDSDTYGTITFTGPFKQQAVITSSDQSWEVKKKSFWKHTLVITSSTGEFFGEFKPKWTGTEGTLTLADGRTLSYAKTSFWSSTRVWADPARGEVLEFRSKPFSKRSVEITVRDTVRNNPLLPFLALFGVLQVVESRKRAAAVAATT